jgi:uncharacterized protein YbjQ (UPF0145 family)
MIITTTPSIDGHSIDHYLGVVTSEVVIGMNVVRDWFGALRDFFGGRTASWERVLANARTQALQQLAQTGLKAGANAIVGVALDYESVGRNGSMVMVTARGTAVQISRSR